MDEIFSPRLNACLLRTRSVSILFQNHPQRYEKLICFQLQCKIENKLVFHISEDDSEIELACWPCWPSCCECKMYSQFDLIEHQIPSAFFYSNAELLRHHTCLVCLVERDC